MWDVQGSADAWWASKPSLNHSGSRRGVMHDMRVRGSTLSCRFGPLQTQEPVMGPSGKGSY